MAAPVRPLDRLEAALARAEAYGARTSGSRAATPNPPSDARAAALEEAVAAALARIDALLERD